MKRFLSIVLSVLMILGTMSFPVLADATTYESQQEFLNSLQQSTNEDNVTVFTMTGDADFTGVEWEPITKIKGVSKFIFDGAGYTISNVSDIEADSAGWDEYAALFAINGMTVKNLTIKDSTFQGLYASTVNVHDSLGNMYVDNVTVDNCTVICQEEYYDNMGDYYGGYAGGVLAYISGKGEVTNCTVKDTTVQSLSTDRHVGGVVGFTQGNILVQNCTVSGNTSLYNPTGSKGRKAGAVIGSKNGDAPAFIECCDVKSTVMTGDNADSAANVEESSIVGWNISTGDAVTKVVSTKLGDTVINLKAAKIGNEYFETVQEAVNSAEAGTTTIQLLPGTIKEHVYIIQKENVNIEIKGGKDVIYNGTFEVCGNNRNHSFNNGTGVKETLTFDGINFVVREEELADTSKTYDFIGGAKVRSSAPDTGLTWLSAHNVTVKNCTFEGVYEGGEYPSTISAVVAMRHKNGYYWNVDNCTGKGLHSFLQSTAPVFTSKINKVTVTNSESALNLGTNANYEITNCVFDVYEFAVRADAKSDRDVDLTLKNNTITADKGLIVRKTQGNFDYDVVLEMNKFDTATAAIERTDSKTTDTINITANSNYWGGGEPTITGIDVTLDTYYTDAEMTNEVYSSKVPALLEKADGTIVAYSTLDAAINSAASGETITLNTDATLGVQYFGKALNFNLNNKTLKIAKATVFSENASGTVFSDGNINFDGCDAVTNNYDGGYNWSVMAFYAPVEFSNVDLSGTGSITKNGVFSTGGNGEMKLTNGSTLTVTNPNDGYLMQSESGGALTLQGQSKVTVDANGGALRGFYYTNLTVDNSEIEFKNTTKAVLKNSSGIIKNNSTVTLDKVEYGIELANSKDNTPIILTVEDSVINITNINNDENAGIYLENRSWLDDTDDGALINSDIYVAPYVNSETGETNFAKKVKLTYEPTEKQNVYKMYIESADGGVINRLSAVQLKFELEAKSDAAGNVPDMSYSIAPASYVQITGAIDDDDDPNDTTIEDLYVFNFTGDNGFADKTGTKIQLGTVTFNGYGEFDFKVVPSYGFYVAKAKTAEATDNIVAEYVPVVTDATKQGLFDLDASALTGAKVEEVKREVKVVIDFNNNLKDAEANSAAYNQMYVTLTGSNGKTYKGVVGSDADETTVNADPYTCDSAALNFEVEANYRYTVTVTGAGYRTARYTTIVNEGTEPLVLNFWNNALEDENRNPRTQEVEAGKKTSAKDVTFLAGDISPDNIIDKYDLAAVVSYFGYDGLKDDVNKYGYAKYDLNRDGIIDADDISWVLVSWGK